MCVTVLKCVFFNDVFFSSYPSFLYFILTIFIIMEFYKFFATQMELSIDKILLREDLIWKFIDEKPLYYLFTYRLTSYRVNFTR